MHVIGRQLLQRRFLGFAEFYDTLHPLPPAPRRRQQVCENEIDLPGTLSSMPCNS